MRKMTMFSIILFVVILGITSGILIHLYNDTKIEESQIAQVSKLNEIKNIDNIQDDVVVAVAKEKKTTPNTIIIFETYYTKCGHLIIEKRQIESNLVNMNEESFKKNYSDWILKKFDTDQIELYKEVNGICDKHYIIHENNGYIAVYTIDDDGNEKLKENTEISTQYLPDEDVGLLKKGIKANGDNELAEKLSDYE